MSSTNHEHFGGFSEPQAQLRGDNPDLRTAGHGEGGCSSLVL